MKLISIKYQFSICLFVSVISLGSCLEDNFPHQKINVDRDFYLIKTERGYAFSSTVVDLEFYSRGSLWWDKSTGHIYIHWGPGADSVDVYYNKSAKLYN